MRIFMTTSGVSVREGDDRPARERRRNSRRDSSSHRLRTASRASALARQRRFSLLFA
jgi:hypothetical protein